MVTDDPDPQTGGHKQKQLVQNKSLNTGCCNFPY